MKFYNTIFLILSCLLINHLEAQHTELTSEEREQFIQKALALRTSENFAEAVICVDNILSQNAFDAPVLLFRGDLLLQAKRFSEAAVTYQRLLPLNYETTIATINLSYAMFMNHQPVNALKYAHQAWSENKISNPAIVNYFNALLWNIKTKEAKKFLVQNDSLLSPDQRLVLQARLFTTSGNYNKGLQFYDSLVNSYNNKYYVQEYTDVLMGKKEFEASKIKFNLAKGLFTTNENEAFDRKLKSMRMHRIGSELIYFKDIANNTRIESNLWWQQAEGGINRWRAGAGTSTITSNENEKTTSEYGIVHVDERWSRAWSGESEIKFQHIQASDGNRFNAFTGHQIIKFQPNDRRMAGITISSDILNFTASLLNKNIRSNNIGYLTHIMLSGKTGIYSQGSYGIMNDGNKRMQFFGSFYKLMRTEPTIKAGLNFSALHFSDNSITTYFSPNRYINTEVFSEYSSSLPVLSKFYLQVQGAVGMQKIETNNWEPSLRFQTEIGCRVKNLETGLKFQTSNVANNTGTGYKFNWFTLKASWKF